MMNLTGFISQVFRGKAIVLQQVAEDGSSFPCDSQMGWAPGDGVRDIDGRRFPESVRNGVTRTGMFQVATSVSGFSLGARVLFDTAPSVNAGYVATNVRAL